jgi:hypothetical protein
MGNNTYKMSSRPRSAAFGINALREGHGIQINVPGPQPTEIDDAKLWPAQWRVDLK